MKKQESDQSSVNDRIKNYFKNPKGYSFQKINGETQIVEFDKIWEGENGKKYITTNSPEYGEYTNEVLISEKNDGKKYITTNSPKYGEYTNEVLISRDGKISATARNDDENIAEIDKQKYVRSIEFAKVIDETRRTGGWDKHGLYHVSKAIISEAPSNNSRQIYSSIDRLDKWREENENIIKSSEDEEHHYKSDSKEGVLFIIVVVIILMTIIFLN